MKLPKLGVRVELPTNNYNIQEVYMKNSVWKIVLLIAVFLGAIIIVLISWFGDNIKNATFQNIILTFSVFSAYAQFLYSQSNDVFIFWNKHILSFFRQSTSAWSATHRYYLKEFNIDNEFNNLVDSLKSAGWKIVKRYHVGSKIEVIASLHGLQRTFKLYETEKNDYVQVKFSYETSINTRKAIKEWANFKRIIGKFEEGLPLLRDISEEDRAIYVISIELDDYNPFYRLAFRHLDKPKELEFNLSFVENGVNVEIEPHTIKATSDNIESVEKVLTDYIVLSRL